MMFTGLIQKVGVLRQRTFLQLEVEVTEPWNDLVFGESIAVNGVCLTLERANGGRLLFHTLQETLNRTNLGTLALGSKVNLERALRLGDRVGGHWVSGHVDSTAKARRWVTRPGGDLELTLELPDCLKKLVAPKGSIAIDGVSLTVVAVREDEFTVELIPVTRQETALSNRPVAAPVNLEGDLLARYVVRQMEVDQEQKSQPRVTMQSLAEAGFLR